MSRRESSLKCLTSPENIPTSGHGKLTNPEGVRNLTWKDFSKGSKCISAAFSISARSKIDCAKFSTGVVTPIV